MNKSVYLRDKTHVGCVLILTIVTIITVAILIARGAYKNALLINNILIVFFALIIVFMVIELRKQIKYNIYSYNTIYYIGFSIFILSVLITHVALTVKIACKLEDWNGQYFLQITTAISSSAARYMLISVPFILIVAIMLFASNVSLIRHEGARFVNTLGIIISLLLVGGEALIIFGNDRVSGSAMYVLVHDIFANVFAAGYLYFECMIIGVMITQIILSKKNPTYNKDFIIILGCGIRKDGTPLPLLRSRIDKAIEFRNAQLKSSGKKVIFIPSGGQGSDEVISESESISRYLLDHGVTHDEIIKEDKSTNTLENMKFSKNIIDKINKDAKVAFATSNYHVFRSGIFASKANMLTTGIGAKSKWYFWPNALVREFIGLLVGRRKSQIIIIGGLIVIYIILTLLCGL